MVRRLSARPQPPVLSLATLSLPKTRHSQQSEQAQVRTRARVCTWRIWFKEKVHNRSGRETISSTHEHRPQATLEQRFAHRSKLSFSLDCSTAKEKRAATKSSRGGEAATADRERGGDSAHGNRRASWANTALTTEGELQPPGFCYDRAPKSGTSALWVSKKRREHARCAFAKETEKSQDSKGKQLSLF